MRPALLALLCLVLAGTAYAGPIAEAGRKAEALMESGDSVGAAQALDEAMEEIWRRSPLLFRKVLFVHDSSGFGLYSERRSNVFLAGEPLVVYVEPLGFAYGPDTTGGMRITLHADFVLTDSRGNELFARDDFLTVSLPVRYRNREFQMKLTVNLTGLSEGSYIARFHVRDGNSDKAGDFELPFVIED